MDLDPGVLIRSWPQVVGRAGLTICVRDGDGGSAGPLGTVAGFATHRRAKALSWLSVGTDDDDALWRRFLLEGVVVAVSSLLRPGSPGETLDPTWGRASAAILRRLPLGASLWMFHRPEGPVELVGGWQRRVFVIG